MVQTLAAAGELQRDLQRELTYDGLRAAEAKGSKGGRRPAVAADKTGTVRTAYLEGRSIAALARDHGVSRGAIRTAVADLMPDHTATEEDAPAPELPVTLDMPGKVAEFLRTTELEPAERAALDQGVTVRRGRTKDKVEVDAVIETQRGDVIGIEVKAGATVCTEDLTGLRNLANLLGDRFVADYVLWTGQQTLPFGDRIRAVPMDALWQLSP
ncbi:hypothetical protein [Streptomyces sp. NPDC005970]|uniref:hypothetical protein n=1 Tax=Streptomyces sp. NPDC005970 TaxID=3156723 RepID=UPI0033FBED46